MITFAMSNKNEDNNQITHNMETTTIYRVNKYDRNTGTGPMLCVCADKQTVINYLTQGGARHGILTDEFNRYSGDDLQDYIADKMVIKFVPEASELCTLLGRPQPEPEYYIIHTFDLIKINQ